MAHPWIWARLAARLWGNRPSPVRKVWGLAVCASRMMPDPSLKGSKATILSYRTRPAAEGAGPVIEAPGHPDAEAVGRAAALPAHDRLQIVNSLDHPDELLRLHQVEGDGSVHALPLGDDAPG